MKISDVAAVRITAVCVVVQTGVLYAVTAPLAHPAGVTEKRY